MANTSDSLMREAREAFSAAVDADRENIEQARRDLEFLAGDQWDPEDERQRKRTGRPALTINRLPQYVRQVTGDMRLNPPGVTVRPVDGGADPDTAKVLNGLIRNIEAQSNAASAYINAGENAARCGVGYFKVSYDYAPGSFDMELGIERIPSPFGAIFYAGATDPTGADAEGVFVQDLIPLAQFKRRYPKASLTSWDDDGLAVEWKQGEFIRVAEWWRKVPVKRELVMCGNGRVFDLTDKPDEAVAQIIAVNGGVLQKRMMDSHRVEMRLVNGVEQLEDTHEWPSCYLPVVRVVGEEINVGDRLVRHGLVYNARGAQVLFNVQRSSYAEAAAMAPKAKWIGTTKQFAGHLDKWRNANQLNLPYLPYTPDEKAPGPPQRVAPEMPAAALLQDVAMAAQDIEATIGIYRENLGKESNAQSGRAILSRQREGDVGTFLYMDNLATAVAHCGRILVDMIPRVYDTPRVVRILGEDGTHESVQINQPIQLADGSVKVANDLSMGRYDVVSSVGPSFSTRREEARESMMAVMSAQPQAMVVLGDLFAKALDWPGSEEFAKRMRRMALMRGAIEPDQSNPDDVKIMQGIAQQGQKPDPQMALAMAEMEKAKAAQMKAQSDAMIAVEKLKTDRAKVMLEAMQAEIAAKQAGVKLSIQAADVESKVRERDAGVRAGVVTTTLDTVERVMEARRPQMPEVPHGPESHNEMMPH